MEAANIDPDRLIRKLHIKKRVKRVLICVLCVLAALIILLTVFEIRMIPIVRTMAKQRARSIATFVVSDSIYEEMKNDGLKYDDLVSLEKDTNGKITALKTNIIYINRIKSYLSVRILEKLKEIGYAELRVPIGTVIGGDMFSGLGPKIHVRIIPVGAVSTDIQNMFSSAGINQTRHEIMMEVRASVSVILPFGSITEDVSSSVCIAETVIVGEVPEAFTNVDRMNDGFDDTVGDINDYGT